MAESRQKKNERAVSAEVEELLFGSLMGGDGTFHVRFNGRMREADLVRDGGAVYVRFVNDDENDDEADEVRVRIQVVATEIPTAA